MHDHRDECERHEPTLGGVAASDVGAPAQPAPPAVSRIGTGHFKVSFTTPPANGAPITSFKAVCAVVRRRYRQRQDRYQEPARREAPDARQAVLVHGASNEPPRHRPRVHPFGISESLTPKSEPA